MKKIFAPLLLLLLLTPKGSEAAPMVFSFCPQNANCGPLGLTTAALVFDADTSTASDTNDYIVHALFRGTGLPIFLDLFSFTIEGVQTPAGYESLPNPISGPAGYTFTFDNISNSGSCNSNTFQAQEVCGNVNGNGVPLGTGLLDFKFLVDLAGNGGVGDAFVTQNSGMNLRALFRDANGNFFGPIMSPNGNYTTTGCVDCGVNPLDGGEVPEPASLFLLGSGLLGVAARMRAKRAK